MTEFSEINFFFLDASAMVKLIVEEADSGAIRAHFPGLGVFHTSALCVAETLMVLKSKWLRNKISRAQYDKGAYLLMAYIRDHAIRLASIALEDYAVFTETEKLAQKHNLDISDALQLLTLKNGLYKVLVGESCPCLVTADSDLATAALAEGLRVWNCAKESSPS